MGTKSRLLVAAVALLVLVVAAYVLGGERQPIKPEQEPPALVEIAGKSHFWSTYKIVRDAATGRRYLVVCGTDGISVCLMAEKEEPKVGAGR